MPYILCILLGLSPRLLGPHRRRHSWVSLGNLANKSPNECIQLNQFSRPGHDAENAVAAAAATFENCDRGETSQGECNNKNKMVLSNVTSIPIVLCGFLQGELFGSNFSLGRQNPGCHGSSEQQADRALYEEHKAYIESQMKAAEHSDQNHNTTRFACEGSAYKSLCCLRVEHPVKDQLKCKC